jgi:hydroxymethylbilane synthase
VNLRIGTRGSALARTQSATVAAALARAGFQAELVVISTAGDRSAASPFADIGPQGVFVREIEQALLECNVDLAVHSCKDLPSLSPPGLILAAVPERLDAADVLIVRESALSDDSAIPLRAQSVVGTASARRRVWLRHLRPDLRVKPLRGNVPTRLGRLREGRFDAIVLAMAGLTRLGAAAAPALDGLIVRRLDPEAFVPAPAQGALAVQCRLDDPVVDAVRRLEHAPSRQTVDLERALLARVHGGCDVAFGAHCVRSSPGYRMVAMLERDGRVLHEAIEGPDPAGFPAELAGRLGLARGAA